MLDCHLIVPLNFLEELKDPQTLNSEGPDPSITLSRNFFTLKLQGN